MQTVKTRKGWYWINETRRIKGHPFWEGPFKSEELAKEHAAQQGLHTDAAIVPTVKADSQSDIIPAGVVDHQPRR